MPLVNGLRVLMHYLICLFIKTHVLQILLVVIQARVPFVLQPLIARLHLLFDIVLVCDLCS